MLDKRKIPHDLAHLYEHLEMAMIDLKHGNLASATTHLKLAMGLLKSIVKRETKAVREGE